MKILLIQRRLPFTIHEPVKEAIETGISHVLLRFDRFVRCACTGKVFFKKRFYVGAVLQRRTVCVYK